MQVNSCSLTMSRWRHGWSTMLGSPQRCVSMAKHCPPTPHPPGPRVCATMARAMCVSMVSTVMSFVWELVSIRALSLVQCSTSCRFRYVFLSNTMVSNYRVCRQGSKMQNVVKITASAPHPHPHSFVTYISSIYVANFIIISSVFGPRWTRMWNKLPISLCIAVKK